MVIVFNDNAHSASKWTAKAWVDSAIRYYKKHGKAKTMATLKVKNGKFHRGSLYVFTWDTRGYITAHPANHGLIGRNVYNIKDPNGFQFVKYAVNTAKKRGSGWVKYKWSNPKTKRIQNKITYFKLVDGIIFACGVYI